MNSDGDVFTYDQAGLQEAIQLEQEAGFDIQIGGRPAQPKPIDPVQLQIQLTKVRLFSVLFAEFRQVLTQANLGAGLNTALDTGRLLIQQRLISLSSDQVRSLESLLANATNKDAALIQDQTTVALFELLLDTDWQTITEAAMQAIQSNFVRYLAYCRSA